MNSFHQGVDDIALLFLAIAKAYDCSNAGFGQCVRNGITTGQGSLGIICVRRGVVELRLQGIHDAARISLECLLLDAGEQRRLH